MKKNLIALIIILFCLTALFLLFVLSSKKIETQTYPLIKIPAKSAEREAILFFSENYLEVQKGEQFNLDVLLDTKKDVFGVDVFLEYNPDLVELESLEVNSEIGNLMKPKREYPVNQIAFSVLAPAQKTFTGNIKIASLTFRAKETGLAEVNFVFSPGSTVESNVAGELGKDILTEVKNAKIKIIEIIAD